MSKKYSEQEAIEILNQEITKDIFRLYQSNCVNWGEKTSKGVYYTEILAKELLTFLKDFENKQRISRTASYRVDSHQQVCYDLANSNRNEDIFAKRICGLEFKELGKVIDYQIPIRDTSKDEGLKGFDLLSYNVSDNSLYIIELKYLNSGETLLRAMLECYTYFKIVDLKKLKADYKDIVEINSSTSVKPVVLLVNSDEYPCKPYKEHEEMESDERPMLKALSLALGIKFVTCDLPDLFYSY